MLILFSAIVIVLSIIQLISLSASLIFSILSIALAGGCVALHFVMSKKPTTKKIVKVLPVLLLVVSMILSSTSTFSIDNENTLAGKYKGYQDLQTAIEKGNAEDLKARADAIIEDKETVYDDDVLLALADACITAELRHQSLTLLNKVLDRTTIDYHLMKVRYYKIFEPENVKSPCHQLTEAVRDNPTWAEGHVLLGCAYYENDDFESALHYLRRAVLMDPYSPEGNFYLGAAYCEMGMPKTALEYLEKAKKYAGKKNAVSEYVDEYIDYAKGAAK